MQPHLLLDGVQTGPVALAAATGEAAAVAGYLWGVHRLARRNVHWPVRLTVAFVAGVAVLWVATGSGVAADDEVSVVAHVVQHVLLMMVAPPLLVLGRPVTLAVQAARRPAQLRLVRAATGRAVGAVTFPLLAWLVYYGTMYGAFASRGTYDWLLGNPLAHDASHGVFVAAGYLYWQGLVGAEPSRWRLSPALRVVSILVGMPFEAFLGIWLYVQTAPIAPLDSLTDTRRAGQAFWILATVASTLWLGAVIVSWYRRLERDQAREDRRAARDRAAAEARAAELGVAGLPPGWTIPPWELARLAGDRDGTGGA